MIRESDIRRSMRITHARLDDDIRRNIDACLLDMERVGINVSLDNALIDKAVELYCKSQFDYLGRGDQFLKNYENMRNAISMSGAYKCEIR